MTRPDIDAIEARLKAATPGPCPACGSDRISAVAVAGVQCNACGFFGPDVGDNGAVLWWNRVLPPATLADLLAYVRELETEIAWHEDRSGTRAEQERQDAEWAADDAKVAAMSEDEIRASLEASGVRVDEAIRRFDVLIRVCTERAALSAQVDRLTAERDRLAQVLRCEREK